MLGSNFSLSSYTEREMSDRVVEIHTEWIELQQLLKLTDFLSTGGDVRSFLAEGEVKLNDEPENRRGRKVRPGDTVWVNGVTLRVVAKKA